MKRNADETDCYRKTQIKKEFFQGLLITKIIKFYLQTKMGDEKIIILNEKDQEIQKNLKQVREINRKDICYEYKTRDVCSH